MAGSLWLVNAGAIVLLCTVAGICALLRLAQLERALASVHAGISPAEEAYQRYAQRDPRGMVRTGLFAAGAGVVVFWVLAVSLRSLGAGVLLSGVARSGSLPSLATPDVTAAVLLPLPLVLALPNALYQMLVIWLADAPALAELRRFHTRPRDLALPRLQENARQVCLLVLFETCVLLYAVGLPGWLAVLVFVGAVGMLYLVLRRDPVAQQRGRYPCVPLEQSAWAALAPRVQDWARYALVEVAEVYVRDTARVGSGDGAAVTHNERSTLFLANTFLARADWRQQDAMICLLLSLATRQPPQQARLRTLYLVFLLGLGALLGITWLLGNDALRGSPIAAMLEEVLPVVSLLALYPLMRQAQRLNRDEMRVVFDADRMAAELTGDPDAVIGMIETVASLNGQALAQRSASFPSPAERIAALERWAGEAPGSNAPSARRRIPTNAPALSHPYLDPRPLAEVAQQIQPPPVPSLP